MLMKTNLGEPITLIDKEGGEIKIVTYSSKLFINPTYVAFKWPDSVNRKLSPKLINWLQTDFKNFFEYNPLLWTASVAGVDPKFQPYLKDLFK